VGKKATLKPDLIPVPRELLRRIQNLELTLLPTLKGAAEEEVRAIIWAAFEAVKKHTFVVEDQSQNGVKVIVHRKDGCSSVDASCDCFGTPFRAHSDPNCPVFLKQKSAGQMTVRTLTTEQKRKEDRAANRKAARVERQRCGECPACYNNQACLDPHTDRR